MGKYDNIINHPHHVSRIRPQMSLHDRAAQFAPFAALTGYDSSVEEAARFVDGKIDLTEDELATLNERIRILQEHLKEQPSIEITYFVPDGKKEGGKYTTIKGNLIKIDPYAQHLVLQDNHTIPFADIFDIQSEVIPTEWE